MAKNKRTEAKPETEATPVQQEQSTSTVGFGATAVVALPKFNPDVRPLGGGTGEQVTQLPIRQSYEDVQREARGPGTDEWRRVDKLRADLTNLYDRLREDTRFTQAHKAETAWAKYEETRSQIEQLAPEARKKMLRSAESLERLSIPVPPEQGLLTKDTDKLLLTAHERSRLEGLINRAEKAVGKGPWKANPIDVLKTAYEQGLDEGGPGGGATVRAVIQLARDYGLDVDTIVDAHRKPRHRESLADAEQALMRAQLVGRSVPQPLFPHPERITQTSRERTGTYGSGAKAFVPQQKGMVFPKRRKRYWQ